MKIDELEIGKHYLLDDLEGNDSQAEVYIVEPAKQSTFGPQWNIHFVQENETLPFTVTTNMMVFHEMEHSMQKETKENVER